MYIDRRKQRRKVYAMPIYYVDQDPDKALAGKGVPCVDSAGAAHLLGITPSAVYMLVRRDTLTPYAKITRGPLFKREAVEFLAWKREKSREG